MSMDDK